MNEPQQTTIQGSGWRPLNIAFVHPDFASGDARRFVVEAALALADAGHRVQVHTTSDDASRAFNAASSPVLMLRKHRGWAPTNLFGMGQTSCSMVRSLVTARRVGGWIPRPHLVFCDRFAHMAAALKRKGLPVLCYGPAPELVPSIQGPRGTLLSRTLLHAQQVGLEAADRIVVSSEFASRACSAAFPALSAPPVVVPPAVDLEPYERIEPIAEGAPANLVWIGNFQASANPILAVQVVTALRRRLVERDAVNGDAVSPRLVLVGEFDSRLADNRRTLDAVRSRIDELDLGELVTIELSPSRDRKLELLANARAVLHTSISEPFAYGPLEAMAAGRPVVCAEKARVVEAMIDGETGRVVKATPDSFAKAIIPLLRDTARARELGEAARVHMRKNFSRSRFATALESLVLETIASNVR